MSFTAVLPTAFHHLSRLRGARVFHPRGVSFHATWLPDAQDGVLAGSQLLDGAKPALVRISHGIGLPATWPDILGLAVRLVDVFGPGRHQDLLFASAGSRPGTRNVLRLATDLAAVTMSTLLPYDVQGRRAPLVAHVGPTANTATYAEIERIGPTAVPLMNVHLGATRGPRIARIVTSDRVSSGEAEGLRFDPWNTGSELEPVGRINELRRPTYRASQDGRDARDITMTAGAARARTTSPV